MERIPRGRNGKGNGFLAFVCQPLPRGARMLCTVTRASSKLKVRPSTLAVFDIFFLRGSLSFSPSVT